MAKLNKVFLIGTLAEEPLLQFTQHGTAIVDVQLSTNRSIFDEQVSPTKDGMVSIPVRFFARQAEVCAESMHKGTPLYVEGRLDLSKKKIFVMGETFQFLNKQDELKAKGCR